MPLLPPRCSAGSLDRNLAAAGDADAATPRPGFLGEPLDMRPRSNLGGATRHDEARLRRACWAFTTRRVDRDAATTLLRPGSSSGVPEPEAGDLVLARVDALGHHRALQLVSGRRRQLFRGDEVVVAYGNRYASAQFESVVPDTLGPCNLVAGGGVASRARSWHSKISRGPTQITPIGLVADSSGRRINLRDFALNVYTGPAAQAARVGPGGEDGFWPTPIAVVGTSMDAGKTQTCAYLARGLQAAGARVGYAKITGTGAGGDYWLLCDAGVQTVLDFTDVGLPTTYLVSSERVVETLTTLVHHLAQSGVDAMVLEIADGVLQRETSTLLRSAAFQEIVGGVVLAGGDSMGAAQGYQWMRDLPTPVLALSGVLTAAPLQVLEAQQATDLPVFDREGLATPENAMRLLGHAQKHLEIQRSAAKPRQGQGQAAKGGC